MKFVVLICTYNRPEELLRKAIHSVVVGTDEKPDELIVVNGGDDRADPVVNEFVGISAVNVRLIKTENINLATSRNIGLEAFDGDILAMTDDDAEVFPDWITQMKRVHAEHPEAGVVGGPVHGTNTDSLVGKVADAITFPSFEHATETRTLAGVNVSYKKEVLDKIGPQDTTLFRGEDVDFNWRVIQEGYTVRYDPSIQVYHTHRPNLKGFYNQQYMYGRAYVLVRRKWKNLYCIYPRGIKRPRDIAKAIWFILSAFNRPFAQAKRIPDKSIYWRAVPILFMVGWYWRIGMIRQMRIETDNAKKA